MNEKNTQIEFSIIHGGLLDRLLNILRITRSDVSSTLPKIVFFVVLAWFAPAILSAYEGLFWTNSIDVPFAKEFATHIRFLVAISLLVLSEGITDGRIKESLNQFKLSGLFSESGLEKFELAKLKAQRMCNSFWAEGIIFVFILANVFFRIQSNAIDVNTWMFPGSMEMSALSLAGYWAAFISFPLFQLLVLRWFWRWIIWLRLLLLISRTDLQLLTAHPDRSGGLGFLGEPPLPFGFFTFILSIVFSAVLAEYAIYQGLVLQNHYSLIAAFIVLCIIINTAPLLVFVRSLHLARIEGISKYHSLIARHYREFEAKWMGSENVNKEDFLGHPDVSSTADISSIYQLAENMKVIPFTIKTMGVSVVIVIMPILAVFALQFPVAQLIKSLAKILL